MSTLNLAYKALNKIKWKVYSKINNEACLAETHEIWINYPYHAAFFNEHNKSHYLLKKLNPYIKKHDKILELGSGTGRNLHYLLSSGYDNVFGIEISPTAIDLMKQKYSDTLHVWNDSIENKIKEIKTGEFDIVFSMAVLMHIHRDSEWVFDEIVRVTKRYLITIEEESYGGKGRIHLLRNFKNIFEDLGMKQVEEDILLQPGRRPSTTRVFSKEKIKTHSMPELKP